MYDMDLFNHALIGDLREDTYAEAEMTEDGRKIILLSRQLDLRRKRGKR
jgi:hypothetical protein